MKRSLVLAVYILMSDAQLFKGFSGGSVLRQQNIVFTELLNDPFRVVAFLWHGSDILI